MFNDLLQTTGNCNKQSIQTASANTCLKQPATTDSSKQWSEGFSVGEFMLFQYVVDNFLVA